MHPMKLIPAFLLALAAALVQPGLAQGEDSNRPPPREPPPEAFQACQDKAAGDACTVKLPDLTLDGKCVKSQQDERVFCMPSQMPPPPPR